MDPLEEGKMGRFMFRCGMAIDTVLISNIININSNNHISKSSSGSAMIFKSIKKF